jgi:hypothetical protein
MLRQALQSSFDFPTQVLLEQLSVHRVLDTGQLVVPPSLKEGEILITRRECAMGYQQ